MVAYPDARICLREDAPSRKMMMNTVDFAFMKTRPGFFTALLFRNILFNSQAFILRPPFLKKSKFESLGDWNLYLEAIRAEFPNGDPDFFCNRGALGQTIKLRTIEQAAHFWDVSTVCEWPNDGDWPLSFSAMHNLIRRIKAKHGLPDCGNLSLYLLCADMVHYKIVDRPSLDEIASIILTLDMGALSGLRLLGYLKEGEDERASISEVMEAVESFRLDALLLLTANGMHDIPIGYIDLEHTLCKFNRLWGLKYYRDSPPV